MMELYFITGCNIIACFISSFIILDKIEIKRAGWKYWLLLLLNGIIVGLLSLFIYPYGKMIVLDLDILLLAFCFCHHRKKQLLLDLRFSVLLGLCEYISYPIYVFVVLHLSRMPHLNMWMNALSLTMTQVFVLFFYYFYKRMVTDKDKEYPWYVNLFQIVILPVFSFINVTVMIMLSAYYMDDVMLTFILLDMIFVVFLNIYLFYLLDQMLENTRLKQIAVRLEEMSKMQYSYYQRMDEKYQHGRQMLHDVKRHLQVLEAMQQNHESTENYLQDMKAHLQQYRMEIYSQHPIINIILHEKKEEARKYAVQVTYQIAPIDFTFMRDMDITVIFANLLDNAIEACKEIKEQRFLNLQIDKIHDFVVIAVKNSAKGSYMKNHSNKHGHHGLGLINVRQTIENYGGNIQVSSDDGEFCIHLYVPIT